MFEAGRVTDYGQGNIVFNAAVEVNVGICFAGCFILIFYVENFVEFD